MKKEGINPGLAVIIVGEDPASIDMESLLFSYKSVLIKIK